MAATVKPLASAAPPFRNSRRAGRFQAIGLSLLSPRRNAVWRGSIRLSRAAAGGDALCRIHPEDDSVRRISATLCVIAAVACAMPAQAEVTVMAVRLGATDVVKLAKFYE